MKVPNLASALEFRGISLSRLQNEGSQRFRVHDFMGYKSIKATE